METLTRQEILDNRRKWIEFLKQPERKKATGFLDTGDGRRCCLGHGCYVLGVKRRKFPGGYAYQYRALDGGWRTGSSAVLRDLVGLKTSDGDFISINGVATCLSGLNDGTDATPQEIGAYLESVIEGGKYSPFRPLTDFPSELENES